MLCGNCGADLPDGSQSCAQCGTAASASPDDAALAVTSLQVCSTCGIKLPAGSLFCLKCGRPVDAAPAEDRLASVEIAGPPARSTVGRARPRAAITIWILLLVLAGLVAWVAFSDNSAAQELREDVTGARAQTIVETPFSVKAHNFSYYEFTVPPGAVNVTVTGEFSAAGDAVRDKSGKDDGGRHSAAKTDPAKHAPAKVDPTKDTDDDIEAYVLSASAFVVWRDGFSTSSYYESGREARGTINAGLPSGAGSYYLVFSNNFSPRTGKTVHATVLLRYRAVLSESLMHLRERLWSWMGFD